MDQNERSPNVTDEPAKGREKKHGAGQANIVANEKLDADELDLRQFLGSIWRGRWTILIWTAIAFAFAAYYAYVIAVPQYRANARLAIQARQEQIVNLEAVISGVATDSVALNTEIEVIRSRALIEELVDNLDLVSDPEFNSYLDRESRPALLKVRDWVRLNILGREGLETVPPLEDQRQRVVSAVSSAINVGQQRNTYLFNISVLSEDRDKSAAIANELAELYIEDQLQTKFAATEYAANWLSERVTELEAELEEKEDEIESLRSDSFVVNIEALDQLNLRARSIEDRVSRINASVREDTERTARIAELVGDEDVDGLVEFLDDPELRRLQDRIATDDGAMDAFMERARDLLTEAENRLRRSSTNAQALERSLEQLNAEIDNQSEGLRQLNQLNREAEATRILYQTFLTRLKETSVQFGLHQADSRVLSTALPGRYVSPKRFQIIVLASIVGALIGIAITVGRQLLQTGFKSVDELETATGIRVFGQTPLLPIKRREELVGYLQENPTSAGTEAIRNLRTSVIMSDLDDPPQVIMSTSSVPGEGKTTTAISLAHNLSGLGKSVLLIECDIRRRMFNNYFKSEEGKGLVSVMADEVSLQDAVFKVSDNSFDVLAGEKTKVNAADIFSSEKFRELVEKAREEYTYVILDTPPVLVVTDARIIAPVADCTLYSVLWNKTSSMQVKEGLRLLANSGTGTLGLCLTKVDPKGMKRYGYGGYYGAYGSDYYHGK